MADINTYGFAHNESMLPVGRNSSLIVLIYSQNQGIAPLRQGTLRDMRNQAPTEPETLVEWIDIKFVELHFGGFAGQQS